MMQLRVKENHPPSTILSRSDLWQPFIEEKSEGLLLFLPMLYVGWVDAVLSIEQFEAIQQMLEAETWLKPAEREQLARWMDLENPPSAADLKQWLAMMRSVAPELSEKSRQTLVELGLAMSKLDSTTTNPSYLSPEIHQALEKIEEALGVVSHEAYHAIVAEGPSPTLPSLIVRRGTIDVTAIQAVLDGKDAAIRNRVRQLLQDPEFQYESYADREAYRAKIWSWCRRLAEEGFGLLGFPKEYGGSGDVAQSIVVMEMLSFFDLSLVIKFGVQFGLFGGSIYQLGTQKHHEKYLRDIGSLALPGCFAMTELGHGSNVRDLQTVARYDRTTQEFVIHTPSEFARKEYIGNSARDGRLATVFAQLQIDGENYGVNAFLVPIRSQQGEILPGIRIEDHGEKMGLNGVDNGRIWFDHVRIPRENMLNRFAEVTADGEYQTEIPGESRRFFTMLGTLVAGRVGVTSAALSAAKSGLTIAIRYAARRRQFGPEHGTETLLLDYPTHQRRLLPLLANVYALDFATKYLTSRYAARTEEDVREIETLAAGLKAFSTWNATKTLQECREACGGQGYMAENRLAAIKADAEIFTTFEGDNTVLMQLVAKARLSEYKQQFNDIRFFGLVKQIAGQAIHDIAGHNPIVARQTDSNHLLDVDFQLETFRHREEALLVSVARRLKKRIDKGMDSYDAMLQCQNHLFALGHAHIERVILEQFIQGIEATSDPAVVSVLEKLRSLFALWHMEKQKGWYLEHGSWEGAKSKAIRRQIDLLCQELSQEAVALVDAFGIPDQSLAAPIAL